MKMDSSDFNRVRQLDVNPIRTMAAAMEQAAKERASFMEAMMMLIRELKVQIAAPVVNVEPKIEVQVPPTDIPWDEIKPTIQVNVPPINIPPAQVVVAERENEGDEAPRRKRLLVHRSNTGLIKSIDIEEI